MNKMILLEGIPQDLHLGVSFIQHSQIDNYDKESLSYLSTFVENVTHTLGIIELNLDNITKLRNFQYVFLEKNGEDKWVKNNQMLKLLIPREFEENELIRGFFSEEIEF